MSIIGYWIWILDLNHIHVFQRWSGYYSYVHILVRRNRRMVRLAINLWNKPSNGSEIHFCKKWIKCYMVCYIGMLKSYIGGGGLIINNNGLFKIPTFHWRAMWWNCFGITFLHGLYILVAWVAYAFYNSGLECDPIKTKVRDTLVLIKSRKIQQWMSSL